MRIDFVRLAIYDVNAAAIGFPPRDAGGEMFVGVGDALVVLFFVLVLFGIGRRIAALPESFDKIVAFFVVGELLESRALFVGNDPDDVLIEPLFIGLAQFLFKSPLLTLLQLVIGRTLQGINRVDGGLAGGCGGSIRSGSILTGRILGRLVSGGGWIGGLLGWLILGDGIADRQTERYQQSSQNRLIRSNPDHERDSCQTTVCLPILGRLVVRKQG